MNLAPSKMIFSLKNLLLHLILQLTNRSFFNLSTLPFDQSYQQHFNIDDFSRYLIPFNTFKTPDSLYHINHSFYPSHYSFHLLNCKILKIGRLQYVSEADKYSITLKIQDQTDSIRLTLWFNSDIYPTEILSLKPHSFCSFFNCHVIPNDFTGLVELTCYSLRSVFSFA